MAPKPQQSLLAIPYSLIPNLHQLPRSHLFTCLKPEMIYAICRYAEVVDAWRKVNRSPDHSLRARWLLPFDHINLLTELVVEGDGDGLGLIEGVFNGC